MKKLLILLLCAFCMANAAFAITDLSELSNEKSYILTCDRGSLGVIDGYLMSTTKDGYEASAFAFIQFGDNYYMYSVLGKAFVNMNGTLSNEAINPITLQLLDGGRFHLLFDETHRINVSSGYTYGLTINSWSTLDAGNQFDIEEVDGDFDPTEALALLNPSYFVTYVVKDTKGNTLFTSKAIATIEGAHITSLPEEYRRPFTQYSETDVTITEHQTTIEFTATWDGPFKLSDSFDSAEWYNMTIRSIYYVVMDETEPYCPKTDANLLAPESMWAFAGDAYNGIVVYNKAAGDGYTLSTDGIYAIMREEVYTWDIGKNNDGFILKEMGSAYNCINQYGGYDGPLRFWNGSSALTDDGSTFHVEEVGSAIGSLSVGDMAVCVGETSLVNVELNNNYSEYTAYQFDVTLPDGVEWVVDKENKFDITLSKRNGTNHQTDVLKLTNGAYRVTCLLLNNAVITGFKGTLLSFPILIGQSIGGQQVKGHITNILFSTNSEEVEMPDIDFTIDVRPWMASDSLIIDVSQFSSPYSDPEEGNFYSLLDRLYECPTYQHPDDDFWHSSWHNGSVTPGTHYFQVDMLEPDPLLDKVAFVFTRRPTENDHTTEWSVRGTNNPNADKTDCEELAYIFTPYGNNTETLVSDVFDPKGYKYLRFYSEAQTGKDFGSRGYFHLARFQLYSLLGTPLTVISKDGGWVKLNNYTFRDTTFVKSISLGKEVILTITPDEGYAVESVIVNGTQDVTDQLVDGQLTLTVNAETTVAVKFELSDFTKLGDVNNDGVITVGDVVLTVNHLIGHSSSKFVLRQADANNDGEVNVGDIDRIIEFITGQKERGYHAPALRMPVITECDDVIMGSVVANGVTIGLQNASEYSAYQMALTLPDGVAPDDVIVNLYRTADHALARGVLPDGRLMLVVYSMSRTPFTGTDGPLLNIVLPDGAPHTLIADDITFVTRQGEVRKFSVLSLDDEEIDGVSNIERQMPNGAGAVYDLSGRRMKSSIFNLPSSILKKGIYIINGKKIIVR